MRGLILTELSIRGLESGSKTQTRRLAGERAQPLYRVGETLYVKEAWLRGRWTDEHHYNDIDGVSRCTTRWCQAGPDDMDSIAYVADGDTPSDRCEAWDRVTPLFMPQWAARFHVEITAVKRVQLQDITEQDANAEGIIELDGVLDVAELSRVAKSMGCPAEDSRAWFSVAWDMLHGDDRTKVWLEVGDPGWTLDKPWKTVRNGSTLWAANPTVDAYTFRLVQP